MQSFTELNLIEPLQRAIKEQGYTIPTPIQAQSIPSLLAGKDLLGCAQTGTGKTAAFTLPMLQQLYQKKKVNPRGTPRALILAPTRELAAQIAQSIWAYGKYLRLSSTVIYGGVGQHAQVVALSRGVDILVATPGRLMDLRDQGYVHLKEVEILVLDEADRMLDMGFIHDIKRIITYLPAKRQSIFFSATLDQKVVALAKTLVHDPVHVAIEPEKPTVELITQSVYFVEKGRKDALLVKLLQNPAFKRVIVFTQMKHVANKVAQMLVQSKIHAEAIHGNKSQNARTAAMKAFRSGYLKVLVATDLAARGIDVDDITHVINYELPMEAETYVHRIGRTARAGAAGQAISFCADFERDLLRSIERFCRQEITVVRDETFHSQAAMDATGLAARPPVRGRSGFIHSHNRGGRKNAARARHGFRRSAWKAGKVKGRAEHSDR